MTKGNIVGGECVRISIVVPVYNTQRYLRRCIDSLLNQNSNDYEIILVNDGSTDGSPQICDEYAAAEERVRVIHQVNGGPSDARNRGMRAAKGEYILFVDSDDAVETNILQGIQEHMEHLRPDMISLNGRFFGGTQDRRYHYRARCNGVMTGKEFLLEGLRKGAMLQSVCLYGYKRIFLEQHHLLFKKGFLHEDAEFTPRALLLAESIFCSSIVFYIRDVREGSITTSLNQRENAIHILMICRELKLLYDGLPDTDLRRWLYNSLVEYYLVAVDRGKLVPSKDKDILNIFPPSGLACRKKTKIKVELFLKYPYIYKKIQFAYRKVGSYFKSL